MILLYIVLGVSAVSFGVLLLTLLGRIVFKLIDSALGWRSDGLNCVEQFNLGALTAFVCFFLFGLGKLTEFVWQTWY